MQELLKFRKGGNEQYNDMIARLYPDKYNPNSSKPMAADITFQVTDACNLKCTYCYQTHKGTKTMKFEYAKALIDKLLTEDPSLSEYVSSKYSIALILDFIGGEPLLEVELIEKIYLYFLDKAIELHHPWALNHMISICTNGVLYFDDKVQRFLKKYKSKLSLSVTIDGNKELHDSCRVFPDGSPSYDIAIAAAKDWMKSYDDLGSKITIAPGNINYVYDAIIHMVELGYREINANTVFEEGWTSEHATIFYDQLKRIADYWIDNDIVQTHIVSLFDERDFVPMDEKNNENWCGGTGSMLSMDPDGYLFPCIRYMHSSLGDSQPPLIIGHVYEGIAQTECTKKCVDCLNSITRRSQSTDECFYCPIATGCAWCSGYNYQVFGTANRRATYICIMHKARALANVYMWNKYYRKTNNKKRFRLYCPKDWALEIIDEKEYNYLLDLSKED